jgi:exosortase
MKKKTAFILIAIVAVLALVYWPTLRWLVNAWMSNDYYSHGFLVPVVSGFFIWTKREYLKTRETSIIGFILIILGVLLYLAAFFWQIRVFGGLSLLIVIVGLVFFVYGVRVAKKLWFPLVFLLFMIPAPFLQEIAYRLQETSVVSSAWLLETLRFPITSTGPEIFMKGTTFTIGLPCSGINTLVALLALSAVYTYILTGSGLKRIGLFIIAFPVAIIANILRITSIIMVAYFSNVETAVGWYHDISSPLFFAFAFLLLILISRIMKCRINYDLFRRQTWTS